MSLIKCRECGKMISSRAESCPNCGYSEAGSSHPDRRNTSGGIIPLVINLSLPQSGWVESNKSGCGNGCGCLIICILILFVISFFAPKPAKNPELDKGVVGQNENIGKIQGAKESLALSDEDKFKFKIGDEIVFDNGNDNSFELSMTIKDHEDLIQFKSTADSKSIVKMINSNQLLIVPRGARGVVVNVGKIGDSKVKSCRVRILDGGGVAKSDVGLVGWIQEEYLKISNSKQP